jgi:hypothetical protein
MTATRRGANSKLSARLRAREDAQRLKTPEASEEEEAANPEAETEVVVEVTDAEKAALNEFTVAQLKERLESLELPTTGRKAELIDRLLEAE